MNQTDNSADVALASIRHNTAAPIQRFLDSVTVARLEEAAHHQNRKAVGRVKPWPSRIGQRLKRMFRA
jgi:hypothetical protein